MRNRMERRDQHPEDTALLKYMDCEQSEREAEEVREHLESCWTCRVRLGKLEDTISAFVNFREQVFSAEASQTPHGFREFSARFSRVVDEPTERHCWSSAAGLFVQFWEKGSGLLGSYLYPIAMVTVMLAIAISFSVLRRQKDSVPSAAVILAQAAQAETIDQNQMLTRTFIVEQKDASSGRIVRRRRVESWKNGSGQRARRVYDENNAMVRGSWIKADGSRVQYQNQREVSDAEQQLPAGENVWELSPSASDFVRLVGTDAELSVQTTPAVYVVGYSNRSSAIPRLRSATLTVRRGDLRAVAQDMVFEGRSSRSEYKIEEVGYEQRPQETADLRYFEPDFRIDAANPAKTTPTAAAAPVTLDEEVRLFAGLDRVGALVGEQLDVSRLPDGALRLHGLVASSGRRREIVRALGTLPLHPGVRVEVATFEEAQKREKRTKLSRLRLDQIEIAKTTFPAEADLRSYLLASGVTGQSNSDEVYRISSAVLERAAASRDHAIALRRIAALFTPQEVQAMSGYARTQWATMVERHAKGFAQSLRGLRADIPPVFHPLPSEPKQAGRVDRGNFWDAVRELDEMAAVINDGVRRSFTVRAEDPNGLPIRERPFWDALDGAIEAADNLSVEMNN